LKRRGVGDLKIRWFVIIRKACWRRSDSVLAGIRNHPALRAPLLEKEGSGGTEIGTGCRQVIHETETG